ncbi:hypothetical protein HDU82_006105 [Entophlyctis luteolus]|nr:hypothetical protein HDU82_006105 [Entophlyctis luteolus]
MPSNGTSHGADATESVTLINAVCLLGNSTLATKATLRFSRATGLFEYANNGRCPEDDASDCIDVSGFLVLPGFVDAGIVNLDSTLTKPTSTELTTALKLAASNGTTVAVTANFSGPTRKSDLAKLPLAIDLSASLEKDKSSGKRKSFVSTKYPSLKLSVSNSHVTTLTSNLKAVSHASGTICSSESPSIWPFLKSKTLEIMAGSSDDCDQSENSELARKLQELLRSVTQTACEQIGGLGKRGVVEAGAIADFMLVKIDDKWPKSTFGNCEISESHSPILMIGLLPQLFLSSSTPSTRVSAVFTCGKLAYVRENTPIARSIASMTLEKFYVTPNLPETSIEAAEKESSRFNNIPEAIEAIKRGEVIIVVDNEDRENEGDFVFAAEDATPEMMAFVIRHSGGVICVPMKGSRLDELNLPLMVEKNEDSLKTAYTISVDVKHGTTTGISSFDRSRTLQALSNPSSVATDFQRPGHVFPLRAVEGGVLSRVGHTEASLDLCVLAGKQPCAGISEVVLDEGGMARRDDLLEMGKRWGLCVITIDALVKYRVENGRSVAFGHKFRPANGVEFISANKLKHAMPDTTASTTTYVNENGDVITEKLVTKTQEVLVAREVEEVVFDEPNAGQGLVETTEVEGKTDIADLAAQIAADEDFAAIDLSENELADDDIVALANALRTNTKLNKLGLTSCEISDVGLSAIADAIASNVGLDELSIGKQKRATSIETQRLLAKGMDKNHKLSLLLNQETHLIRIFDFVFTDPVSAASVKASLERNKAEYIAAHSHVVKKTVYDTKQQEIVTKQVTVVKTAEEIEAAEKEAAAAAAAAASAAEAKKDAGFHVVQESDLASDASNLTAVTVASSSDEQTKKGGSFFAIVTRSLGKAIESAGSILGSSSQYDAHLDDDNQALLSQQSRAAVNGTVQLVDFESTDEYLDTQQDFSKSVEPTVTFSKSKGTGKWWIVQKSEDAISAGLQGVDFVVSNGANVFGTVTLFDAHLDYDAFAVPSQDVLVNAVDGTVRPADFPSFREYVNTQQDFSVVKKPDATSPKYPFVTFGSGIVWIGALWVVIDRLVKN